VDTNIQRLCVDLGNGGFKGASVRVVKPAQDEQPEVRELFTAYVPSKVGVGDTSLGALSLGAFGKRTRSDDKPIQIVSDDGAYLVGPNVERYAPLLERFDPSKYADSPELRAVTRALLAQMVDGGSSDVAIIAALPVDMMMSPNAKETIKGIEQWLLGEHRFSYDGTEACVNVRAVKALAQPVGAFFAWGLDLAGEWARADSDLADATVAVLDSGFNTLDLLLVRQGRVEKRETGGDNLGVRVAAQEIANALKARFGIVKSLIEVDALIRQYFERGKVILRKEDMTPIVKQALQSLATKTVGYVESKWGNAAEFDYVLLAGGGALALDGAIRRHVPRAEMLPDPVHANAIGLAKLAQRAGTFRGL
jgi:Actin like proteins N terminal domain/Archaeal actin homologue MreB-like, C-terminal